MSELFDVVLNEADVPLTRDQLAAAMQDCDVLVPTVTDRIDADLIGGAGERLGLIASFGAGTEHIDLAAAADRKIIVTNTPGVFTDDTADLTMAGIIGVPRRIREGTALVRRGEWTGWAPSGLLGRKLAGKVLGIIGMGRIGQAVAHRARASDSRSLITTASPCQKRWSGCWVRATLPMSTRLWSRRISSPFIAR
jgi:glyoxylate reductase